MAPAAANAAFFACADSASPPLLAPACPNWTSLLKSLAQVPLQHQEAGRDDVTEGWLSWGEREAWMHDKTLNTTNKQRRLVDLPDPGHGWLSDAFGLECINQAVLILTCKCRQVQQCAGLLSPSQHKLPNTPDHRTQTRSLIHSLTSSLTPDLSQHHNHLDLRDVLVPQAVIRQS
jgi:hypothetical protein